MLEPPIPSQNASASRLGESARVLHEVFGHRSFRGDQRRVCDAVIAGRDAMVVMPTGAGKSLCFQLPALVRGGTCLVVSPLVALIEDQVAKLRGLGLRAERIHSGVDRETSREICKAYLRGELQFLYIAPERLRVPGFLEFLAKRTPSLVAIDEAHCISHWGHDFRPEYRMLGERLPALRPAPIIALTATATADVQEDIARQLNLGSGTDSDAEICISGFRRTNLAVRAEVMLPSERVDYVHEVLSEDGRLPAIVYAPTRREVEALSAHLSAKGLKAIGYHAGMAQPERERAQEAFLHNRAHVIVATVAFGMGIDKANVRTVIHAGLPGSLEGYYQEIGRAGRDGLPSDVHLIYSHADRRTQEFLLAKSYPDPVLVKKVYLALSDSPRSANDLAERLGEEADVMARSLEQLWVQGGAQPGEGGGYDEAPTFLRGDAKALARYTEQRARRHDMLQRMLSFVRTEACRMLDLVSFFGDTGDSGEACGICDRCLAPAAAQEPSAAELRVRVAVSQALAGRSQTTGQLARALEAQTDRDSLTHVLENMRIAGLLAFEAGAFEKDGKRVSFERVRLLSASEAPSRPRVIRSGKIANTLEAALRDWRRRTAAEAGIPAFRVLTDRTLAAIVERMPEGEEELLGCTGVGPMFVSRFGREVLNLLRDGGVGNTR